MTGGKFSLKKIYLVERNHLWVAAKNFPCFLLAAVPLATILRCLVQAYSLLKGAGELNRFSECNRFSEILSTYVKAYAHMLTKLPAMLAKRRSFHKRLDSKDTNMVYLIRKFCLPLQEIIGLERQ